MFCSTIIPTIGRASLKRAVESVLNQQFSAESFELIVVNDAGTPLPNEEWQADARITIVETNQHERSFARNTGAIMAKGRYVHFLDDDDWLLPTAFQTFYDLARVNSADWIYGGSQLVNREGEPIMTLDHQLHGNCFAQTMAGEWLPLQSSIIDKEAFFAIGGFQPLTLVSEDVDLARRITLNGDVAGSAEIVAAIERGQSGSTTDFAKQAFYSRSARELILNEPGVLARLQSSANSSFLQGRIVRLYLTSVIHNLRAGNVTQLISRLVRLLLAAGYGVRHWVSAEFWHAIVKQYQSPTFARGALAAGRSALNK